jgi:hypothetical protein
MFRTEFYFEALSLFIGFSREAVPEAGLSGKAGAKSFVRLSTNTGGGANRYRTRMNRTQDFGY